MFCDKCGKQVKPEWKFCKFCGNVLDDGETQEEKVLSESPENENTETAGQENTDPAMFAETIIIPDEVREEADPDGKTIVFTDEMLSQLRGGEEKKPEKKTPSKAAVFFKKNMAWIIPVGAVLLAGIIALTVFLATRKEAFSLSDIIKPEVEGFDGSGKIVSVIDNGALFEKVLGPAPEIPDGKTEAYEKYVKNSEKLISAISWDVAFSDGKADGSLSNGDKVKITVKADEKVFSEFGFSLKENVAEKDIEIGKDTEALSGFSSLDIFGYFEVAFEGLDGKGKIAESRYESDTIYVKFTSDSASEITVSGNIGYLKSDLSAELVFDIAKKDSDGKTLSTAKETVNVSVSKTSDLSNGDKITFTADEDGIKRLEEHGISVNETEKTFTVEGLQKPVSLDLLAALDVSFSGTDGDGFTVISTGEKTVPLSSSLFGETSVKINVTVRDNYFYSVTLTVPDPERAGKTVDIKLDILIQNYVWLQNGDSSILSLWLEDKDKLEEYGINLTSTRRDVTVSGLAQNPGLPQEPDVEENPEE